MNKEKLILLIISFLFLQNICSQRMTSNLVVHDSLRLFNYGIYLSFDDFLNNSPSITYNFELINYNPDYLLFPGERNDYYLVYYDSFGGRVELLMDDIWGFCDKKGVFVSFKKKPYELIYIGSISILRYEHAYKKGGGARTHSSVVGVWKLNDAYLDLRTGDVYPKERIYFEEIISENLLFYKQYKKDKEFDRKTKHFVYFKKYNLENKVNISRNGIEMVRR